LWDAGWKIFLDALDGLSDADISKTVMIRAEPHSVMQAINRQLAHYPLHIGQIVFLAKHFASDDWKTLSVPRKGSSQFTADVAAGLKSQR
jgi:D-tyrosyl-tRNA(Tyr) deacylase